MGFIVLHAYVKLPKNGSKICSPIVHNEKKNLTDVINRIWIRKSFGLDWKLCRPSECSHRSYAHFCSAVVYNQYGKHGSWLAGFFSLTKPLVGILFENSPLARGFWCKRTPGTNPTDFARRLLKPYSLFINGINEHCGKKTLCYRFHIGRE